MSSTTVSTGSREHTTSTRVNVGNAERIASAAAGGLLALVGLRRGGVSGLLVAVGGILAYRGITGRSSFYQALGMNSAGSGGTLPDSPTRTATADAVITVNRPADALYRLWRDVERAPEYMLRIRDVQRLGPKRSHWTADGLFGRSWEWDSEVTTDRADEFIAWESLPGSDLANAGTVSFHPLATDPNRTEIRLTMRIDPPLGRLGDLASGPIETAMEQLLREDLRRFKQLAETGEITVAEAQPSASAPASAGAR